MKSQPKPDRYARPDRRLDYTRLAHPKNPPLRSAKFRAFVRSFGCCIRGLGDHICGPRVNGKVMIDFAHIGTTGMGMKSSDNRGIGLCHDGHCFQHSIGWPRFIKRYEIDPDAIAQKFVVDYEKRGGAR